MKKNIRQLVFKIVSRLKVKYHPQKIILFGSYAWGRPANYSDLDILIVKQTKARHIDRAVKVCEILDDINKEVSLDPIVYTQKEISQRLKKGDDFISNILNNGIILYG